MLLFCKTVIHCVLLLFPVLVANSASKKNILELILTFHISQITKRLSAHPCVITVKEMGSARHFLKTTFADKSPEERLRLLQPTLEINPRLVVLIFTVEILLEAVCCLPNEILA